MTWFYSPLITPAQGAGIFFGCLAVYGLVRGVLWFFAEPSILPEMHEHVDGGGR